MTDTRVNELDPLRFLAAFAVVFFHYAFRGHAGDAMSSMPYPLLAPYAKYGYLGLELLFMISGFVISMTACSRSVRQFVISRIARLYPAFWVCCTITFVVTVAIGAPRYATSVAEYLANMTMVSAFFGVPMLDGAYWFLYVELIFYALVAAALLIGGKDRFHFFLIGWLLIEVVFVAVPSMRVSTRLLADYSVCFIAGAAFFLIWSQGLSATRIATVATAFGLAFIQAIDRLPGFEKHYGTTMDRRVVAGILVTSFLLMLLIALKRSGPLARARWALAGAISYPIYLLHQHIGFMIFNALYPAINPHVLFWSTIALVTAAGYLVHVFVEARFSRPMLTAVNRIADRVWPH